MVSCCRMRSTSPSSSAGSRPCLPAVLLPEQDLPALVPAGEGVCQEEGRVDPMAGSRKMFASLRRQRVPRPADSLHGTPFRIVATYGNPVPLDAQLAKDIVNVASGERYDVIRSATKSGRVHCHINQHLTSDGGDHRGGSLLTNRSVRSSTARSGAAGFRAVSSALVTMAAIKSLRGDDP